MGQRLSGQQLAIMRVLWARGSATVAQVQQEVSGSLAYSTVATLLSRMERKGAVRHHAVGRTFVYEPRWTERNVGGSLVRDLLARAFGGSASQLVSSLLQSGEVDRHELHRIKQLIVLHKAARGSPAPGANVDPPAADRPAAGKKRSRGKRSRG